MNDWREYLIAARKRQKLSVAAVAAAIGTHRSVVYRWENGERWPEVDNLRRWADALGVQVEVVVHDSAAPVDPVHALIARLQRVAGSLDARTVRMLEAQVDILTGEDVKKVS